MQHHKELTDFSTSINNLSLRNGVLVGPSHNEGISYPGSGHQSCFQLEDRSFWFKHRNHCLEVLVDQFREGDDFFEVGGGNGFISWMLQEKLGLNIFLIEPGFQGCENAASRGVKNVVCSTFDDLEFKDSSVSNIGLFDVLEHIKDDASFLKSLNRKLKLNSGRLYLTVPSYSWLWSDADVTAGHFRRYHLENLRQLISAAGFEIEFASYFFSFLPPAILLKRTLAGVLPSRKGIQAAASDHVNKIPAVITKILDWELGRIKSSKTIPVGSSIILCARKASHLA